MIENENWVKNYVEKIQAIDSESETLSAPFLVQRKIEAHLELMCLLGIAQLAEKTSGKKR